MGNVGGNHHKLCMIHSPVLPLLIEVTFFLSLLMSLLNKVELTDDH